MGQLHTICACLRIDTLPLYYSINPFQTTLAEYIVGHSVHTKFSVSIASINKLLSTSYL